MESTVIHGNCLDILPTLAAGSIHAVVTDPPYPCIKRSYGMLTEPQWHTLMDGVVAETRRVLKPTGSAVFVLQPNSKHVGEMRLWLWEWFLRTAKAWNLVQDAYWWNFTMFPTIHVNRRIGLLRPSVKMCCWFGSPSCYRRQEEILWGESDAIRATKQEDRALRYQTCGVSIRPGRMASVAAERGGSTPFNLIPVANADSQSSSGAKGHGAGTPRKLCEWWVKYLCPPGGTVLDPFNGAGTVGVAAVSLGRNYIGIEQHSEYCDISRERIAAAKAEPKSK